MGQDIPRAARQHCAAVGRSALAVHFSYFVANAALHAHAPGLLGQYERCGRQLPCSLQACLCCSSITRCNARQIPL